MLRLRSFQAFGYGFTATINPMATSLPRKKAFIYPIVSSSSSSSCSAQVSESENSASSSSSSSPPLLPHGPDIDAVLSYHERTKHSPQKYAQGPQNLDFSTQPSPFRRYQGLSQVPLRHYPLNMSPPNQTPYPKAFTGFHDVSILSKIAVSQLLYDSVALSGWRKVGDTTWSLRVNPSSGNLHPTEVYFISGTMLGIHDKPFVAHYCPKEHALEIRGEIPYDLWVEMKKDLPNDVVFLGFSSIYWRESWKYGERAFRYVHQDIGHILGSVSMAGCGLGWDAILVDGWGNDDLDHLLGLHNERKPNPAVGSSPKGCYPELEQEHSVCLVACFPGKRKVNWGFRSTTEPIGEVTGALVPSQVVANTIASRMSQSRWGGRPTQLSSEHLWWDAIDRAIASSKKPTHPVQVFTKPLPLQTGLSSVYKPYTLREVILKRRSAVKMDPAHVISSEEFYQIMAKSLPSGPGCEVQGETAQWPFRVLPWDAEVHMAVFVHKVAGLSKGLYFLVRNSAHEQKLRKALRPDFVWEKPAKCPESLPLYRLAEADCETLATQVSCLQDIAGSGCFSIAMIGRFDVIKERGAWMYSRLFWESGVLGQCLYLEAHAFGISAAGIGAYFDDPVHEILGLQSKEFQSLYLFTVGASVEDKRITKLPPYPAPKPRTPRPETKPPSPSPSPSPLSTASSSEQA